MSSYGGLKFYVGVEMFEGFIFVGETFENDMYFCDFVDAFPTPNISDLLKR